MFKRKNNIFYSTFKLKTSMLNSGIPRFPFLFNVCLLSHIKGRLERQKRGGGGSDGGEHESLSVFEVEQNKAGVCRGTVRVQEEGGCAWRRAWCG